MPRSLAPFGKTTKVSRMRLADAPLGMHDAEVVMMRLWAEENKSVLNISFGLTPLHVVTHRCGKRCKREHHYRQPDDHDIRLVAATVQWMASPIGRAFYERFLKEVGCEVHFDIKRAQTIRELRETKQGRKKKEVA